DLARLIATVMRLGMEHAGADRGLLILPLHDAYQIEAEAVAGPHGVTVSLVQEPVTPSRLPESIFRYVIRTRDSVIVADAAAPNEFSEDDSLRRDVARSVLCLPLVKQGQMVGVLLLENHLASYAFTPARVAVLKLLASQAAISLAQKQTQEALSLLQTELAHVARVTTLGELAASIAHEVNQPLASVVTNAYAAQRWLAREPPDLDEVRTALQRIIQDGNRASEVLSRIRTLLAKKQAPREVVGINEILREVV